MHQYPIFNLDIYQAECIRQIRRFRRARTADSEIMKLYPATNIDEIISLQPGVATSDSGVHIRGGKEDEITYFAEGIEIKIPNFGWRTISMPLTMIQEMPVIFGAMNAEYGNTQSAIIRLAALSGGVKHSGQFSLLTDELFSSDRMNFGYNQYNLRFSGPLARRWRYLMAGELMLTNAYQEALYKTPSRRMDYCVLANIRYHLPDARGRLSLIGSQSREQFMLGIIPLPNTSDALLFLIDKPMARKKSWFVSGQCYYMLSSRHHLNLNLGYTHFDQVFGSRDYAWEDENETYWHDDYRISNEPWIGVLDQQVFDTDKFSMIYDSIISNPPVTTDRNNLRENPYGLEGLTDIIFEYPEWKYWNNSDLQLRGQITSSLSQNHELKAGIEYIQYFVRYYKFIPTMFETDPLNFRFYERKPSRFAVYVQDKIRHGGIFMNLGLRFDIFNANALDFGQSPMPTPDYSRPIRRISPRLATSLPMHDRFRFFFNYGHYYQTPLLDYYFDDWIQQTDPSDSIINNPELEPGKLVSYETGMETVFFGDLMLIITLYHKDYENLAELRRVATVPSNYYQYDNDGTANVKGIEFVLKKSFSQVLSSSISYTLQFTQGLSDRANQQYYEITETLTKIRYWLDHDERHNIIASLTLNAPRDYALALLQNTISSVYVSHHGGHPYTPTDLNGSRLDDANTRRMPGYWNVDWKTERRIQIGGAKVVLTALINNLFNTEQVIRVYGTTGKPDDHGDPVPPLTDFNYRPISNPHYSPQADYNHDGLITPVEMQKAYVTALTDYYSDPTNYRNPFRLRLGIGIEF